MEEMFRFIPLQLQALFCALDDADTCLELTLIAPGTDCVELEFTECHGCTVGFTIPTAGIPDMVHCALLGWITTQVLSAGLLMGQHLAERHGGRRKHQSEAAAPTYH